MTTQTQTPNLTQNTYIDYTKYTEIFLEMADRLHQGKGAIARTSTGSLRAPFRIQGRPFSIIEQPTAAGYTSQAANLARMGHPVFNIRDEAPGVPRPLIGYVDLQDNTFNIFGTPGAVGAVDDFTGTETFGRQGKVVTSGGGALLQNGGAEFVSERGSRGPQMVHREPDASTSHPDGNGPPESDRGNRFSELLSGD